jgi:hypothetical protein
VGLCGPRTPQVRSIPRSMWGYAARCAGSFDTEGRCSLSIRQVQLTGNRSRFNKMDSWLVELFLLA